ncbi:hypothetical protein KIN20_024162 [Parelaphostrongylus tenuis]|uniref:Uncharacterized protein n=1 Tax=Parelaphostrongylus tenuis TaxID=148309 RepID=A0AAD5MT27_PARTN|nr:hypothetical protein KIN20_024162 [Parelaphostrongylus tenuis]
MDRICYYSLTGIRFTGICIILFLYICSLSNISTAFSLLGSRGLGKAIKESPLVNDPISAVVVGMLATVILQSATTTTNILIQSTNIFSASLTPLVGSGVITLEQMYPLILGANIGGSFSAVLAALTADGSRFEKTLHMALCQVIYNIIGTFMFYLIPWTRKLPIFLAKQLGETTDQLNEMMLPSLGVDKNDDEVIVACHLAYPSRYMKCYSGALPPLLRTWKWLPVHLRSLKPYDQLMTNIFTSIPLFGNFFRKGSTNTSANSTDSVNMMIKLSAHSRV